MQLSVKIRLFSVLETMAGGRHNNKRRKNLCNVTDDKTRMIWWMMMRADSVKIVGVAPALRLLTDAIGLGHRQFSTDRCKIL